MSATVSSSALPADPESMFEEMKRYVRFVPEDEAALAELRPQIGRAHV